MLYLLWLLIGLQRVKGSDVFYQFQRRNNTIFYFSRLCGYKEIASRFSPRLFRARVSEPYPNTSILIWTCLLARCSYRYSFICSWNSSVTSHKTMTSPACFVKPGLTRVWAQLLPPAYDSVRVLIFLDSEGLHCRQELVVAF